MVDNNQHERVLFKAGALLLRRGPAPEHLVQVAVYLNNNSHTFMDFTFRLAFLLDPSRYEPSDYKQLSDGLVTWVKEVDPDNNLSRVKTWRDHELSAVASFGGPAKPSLQSAFIKRKQFCNGEERCKADCLMDHPVLRKHLATIALHEQEERKTRQDGDDVSAYRVKWDVPKGACELSSPKLSAMAEVKQETVMNLWESADPFYRVELSEKVPGQTYEIASKLFCWHLSPGYSSHEKPLVAMGAEFDTDEFKGDSEWCNLKDFLKDLKNPLPKYWAVPKFLHVACSTLAAELDK
eukprot:CAMPEP_0117674086 /NCGR_PEP_ID=MMETSP0804-20121206/14838_1 /TAXON_ID=1074897 /ORGANISM="Tetraselmis astigmatica, Strain CCMP880" /LENGTH=293 /DNA_ID=CAMNT_0005482907 /DNA_START=474 /DNA_END=1352 /DNA_ORIENTATION=-